MAFFSSRLSTPLSRLFSTSPARLAMSYEGTPRAPRPRPVSSRPARRAPRKERRSAGRGPGSGTESLCRARPACLALLRPNLPARRAIDAIMRRMRAFRRGSGLLFSMVARSPPGALWTLLADQIPVSSTPPYFTPSRRLPPAPRSTSVSCFLSCAFGREQNADCLFIACSKLASVPPINQSM